MIVPIQKLDSRNKCNILEKQVE